MHERAITIFDCPVCLEKSMNTSQQNGCLNVGCIAYVNRFRDCQPDNAHYKMGGIDPCQYVEAMGTAEFRGACVLNILKYITRYPYKGTPLEDLAKAQDYLNKLIEHEKARVTDPSPPS